MRYFILYLFMSCSVLAAAQRSTCVEVNEKLNSASYYSSIVQNSEKVLGNNLIVGNGDITIEQLEQAVLQAYPSSTFQLVNEFTSPIDDAITVYRYIQSINGKEIENGGYTISARGNGPVGPPGPSPCYKLVSFSPYLMSFDVKNSVLNKTQVRNSALAYKPEISKIEKVSLAAIQDESSPCKRLSYKVLAVINNELSIAYMNAHDGTLSLFKKIEDDGINAPTLYYGPQNMEETATSNNGFRLESSNGVVTHNYTRISGTTWDYDDVNIPVRQNGNSWPIDATTPNSSSHVYQTHFAAVSVIEPLSDVGINFDKCFIKTENTNNAFSRSIYEDRENAYVRFGFTSNHPVTGQFESYGSIDVVGHELGHSFISRHFVSSLAISGRDGRTLHEGLADIIGTYAESRVQGFTDLINNDDSPNLGPGESLLDDNRPADMVNHPFPCFLTIPDCDPSGGPCPYNRSGPIVKWFTFLIEGALIVDGEVSSNIEPLDIQVATSIVTESITMLNSNTATIPDLRDATLATALTHFGQCSKEFTSIAKAWNEVCVGNTPVCEFTISGPKSICDNASTPIFFNVVDPIPGAAYRWYFPIQWTVEGTSGNNYIGGSSLKVTNIPNYTSYPVPYTIQVYPVTAGASFTEELTGKIINCSGDPCGKSRLNGNIGAYNIGTKKFDDINQISSVIIYDLLGRKQGLYKSVDGEVSKEVTQSLRSNSVYIFTYINNEGQFIHSKKRVIIH